MAEAKERKYRWESLKDMPTKRVFSTPVIHGDNIYVLGGCDQRGTPMNTLEVYLSQKREWKSLAPMPTKRAGVTAMAVGNKVIAIGGVALNQAPLDIVEAYNIEENKWTSLESLTESLMGVSAVVRNGKILVIGGMATDSNPRDYFTSLDIEKNRWQSLPHLLTPRYATFAFIIKNKLYVLGGRQGKLPTATFEVYDFEQSSWETLPNIPSKRVFAMYTCTDTHIFSMGGLKQPAKHGFSDDCEIFSLETKKWSKGVAMPTKRGDFAIGVVGDKVICAGGIGNQGCPLDVVEQYDVNTDSWTELKKCPSSHCSCAYIMFNDRLHIIGGLSLQGPSGCMEALSCT